MMVSPSRDTVLCVAASAALLLATSSCHNNAAAPSEESPFNYVPPYSWTMAGPDSMGIDTTLLKQGLAGMKALPYVFSMLMLRDSFLVAEYYPAYLTQLNDCDIRSASKSFISALIGIAVQQGLIDSLGQPVYNFFPEYDTTGMDPRKREITLRHLLTMRAGYDYTEGADYSGIFTPQANWAHEILKLPLKYNPGEQFHYSTIQTHLLAVILTRVSGMSALDFADRYLFRPLSVGVRSWYADPQGYYYGGTGMNLTPRDLARFGCLYLRRGHLQGRQVVAETWIDQSVQSQNSSPATIGPFNNINYGLSWWTEANPSDSLYMALGYAGQIIMVVPAKDLVIVVTSSTDVSSEVEADDQMAAELAIIDQYFLPAARPINAP